jgi:K+-transporting ATPase KdpF subunit
VPTPEIGDISMTVSDAVLLVVSALIFGYLLYALLKAEEF